MKNITFLLLTILPFLGFGQTWDFTNSKDGWTNLAATQSPQPTYWELTSKDGITNPGLRITPPVPSVDPATFTVLAITMKNLSATGPELIRAAITTTGDAASGIKYVSVPITKGDTGYKTYYVVCSGSKWIGTVSELKLQFKTAANGDYTGTGNEVFHIDKIKMLCALPLTEQLAYEFNTDSDDEGWVLSNGTSLTTSGGITTIVPTVGAATKISQNTYSIDADSNTHVDIVYKNESADNNELRLQWQHEGDCFSAFKGKNEGISTSMSGFSTLTVDLTTVTEWAGEARKFQIILRDTSNGNKASAGNLIIDRIEFYTPVIVQTEKNSYTFDTNEEGWVNDTNTSLSWVNDTSDGDNENALQVDISGNARIKVDNSLYYVNGTANKTLKIVVKNQTTNDRIRLRIPDGSGSYNYADVLVSSSDTEYKTYYISLNGFLDWDGNEDDFGLMMNSSNNPTVPHAITGTCFFSEISFIPTPTTNTSIADGIWNDNSTWQYGKPIGTQDLNINHEVTVDINAFANDVTVGTGDIVVNPSKSLTIIGALTNNGTITLNSTSLTYSSLIPASISGTGTVNYNRYVNEIGSGTTGGNDIISAPLSGQQFGAFATANPSLAASGTLRAFAPFNNTSGAYVNYDTGINVSTPLDAGTGYRAASSTTGGSTLTFTGTVNTGTVGVPITVGTHPTYGGWNLIGNPYPSYLSFKAFFDAVADVDYTIPETPAVGPGSLFEDTYDAVYGYNSDTSIWTIWDLNNLGYDSDKIAPGQGFFVKSAGEGTVTFTNAMRSIGNSDDFIANKTTTSNVAKSTIKLTTSTKEFNTNLYFRDGNTRGLDRGYDTAAFIGSAEGIFSNLVDENTGEELYNQSLPYSDLYDVIVPLGIRASAGEQISISLDDTATTMPSNINVYLEDTVANSFTLLNDGDYTITLPTTLDGTGRYFVRFQSEALSINDESLSGLQIYTPKDSKTIIVKGNLQSDTQLAIYDIQGRVMLQSGLDTSTLTNTISTESLNTGIYIVQLTNTTQSKTQKVIIK